MSNFLHEGYLVKRSNGSTEEYLDWNLDEVKEIEKSKGKYDSNSTFVKFYAIDNETHIYHYDDTTGEFTDYNEWADEYTVYNNVGPELAGYLWATCTEIDEESVRAFYMMACDVFGGYANWKANALSNMISEFQRDETYIIDMKNGGVCYE